VGRREIFRCAADHDGEARIARAFDTAANGSVEESGTDGSQTACRFTRGVGGNR
jgi:hypothetical protein